jgi:ABC-type nitrate/sulfonate/bicarbonate transport system substrate-binding protein
MARIRLSLLRGVCQMPAYAAYEKGFFRDEGLEASIDVQPTAWMVPEKLAGEEGHFAVIPWTRVAVSESRGNPLLLLCGSGDEEAAMVVRKGLAPEDVRTIAIPQQGGMKDLTAMALIKRLHWEKCDIIRQPSGDGAIIALFGQGADAASMVEPYATMLEQLGVGTVIQRTSDVWPGAPGCSLTASAELVEANPELVQSVVNAFVRGAAFTETSPDESAMIASRYIGVGARFIRKALDVNKPNINAIRNQTAMQGVLELMAKLGYIRDVPANYVNLRFLDHAAKQVKPG